MKFLKPIPGEEWIEKKRELEFWITTKHSYPEKFYARFCKSYIGWRIYFRLRAIWGRASILVDPISRGGLRSHVRSFLLNWVVVDIWQGFKHFLYRKFHPNEWRRECALLEALFQAKEEGYVDPMPPPPGFEGMPSIGGIMGERYFKRVKEILDEKEKEEVVNNGDRNSNDPS